MSQVYKADDPTPQGFLDYEGVKHLWSKVSMKDYPNNETLAAVINAIDETKADKSELFSGSWNDLSDKPFGENEKVEITHRTIEYNYAYINLNTIDVAELLSKGSFLISVNNIEYEMKETSRDNDSIGFENIYYTNEQCPIKIRVNTAMYEITVYASANAIEYPFTLSIYKNNLKQLDSKFIGQDIARVSDIPTDTVTNSELHSIAKSGSWNDLEDKPFGEEIIVSSDSYAMYNESWTSGKAYVRVNGVEYYLDVKTLDGEWLVENHYTSSNVRYLGNTSIIVDEELLKSNSGDALSNYLSDDVPFVIVWCSDGGACIDENGNETMDWDVRPVETNSKQLDEKFIPSTIARISDLENIDLTPYETKTDAAAKLEEAKAFASEEDAKVQAAVEALDGKVTALIAEDANKSIRTIANEELAKQLVAEGAKESLDTLTEIAAWIQSHPDDASAMNKAINDLEALVGALPDGVSATTIVGYIQEVVAANKALIDTNTEAIDALHAVANSGSWNDLEDKPFSCNSEVYTIFDNLSISKSEFYPNGYRYDIGVRGIGRTEPISAGSPVTLILDGITYSDETKARHLYDLCAGNLNLIDSTKEDTGEDFYILLSYARLDPRTLDITLYLKSGQDSYNNCSLIIDCVEIKQLDEKFIPDTIARVADIPTDTVTNSELHSIAKSGSWNDLEDKPFGEVEGKNVLFAEGEYPNHYNYEGLYISYNSEYKVKYDGEVYTCVCKLVYTGGQETYYLGNGGLGLSEYDVTDNGMPFCVVYDPNWDGGNYFYFADGASHTLEIYKLYDVTQTLDSKYIPDTIARVSDIPKELTAEDAIALATETGLIDPIATTSDNTVLTDVNNNIITL